MVLVVGGGAAIVLTGGAATPVVTSLVMAETRWSCWSCYTSRYYKWCNCCNDRNCSSNRCINGQFCQVLLDGQCSDVMQLALSHGIVGNKFSMKYMIKLYLRAY